MGQRETESNLNDSIDEFFEPMLGDAIEDVFEQEEPKCSSKKRLAELRRRAEQRLEDKRMQEELGYMDLDWDD
jgi:hypothetical protein